MARALYRLAWFAAGALAALALGVILLMAMRLPMPEGAVIDMPDGLYTVADRSVACRSERGLVACTNGRVIIECNGERCRPYYLASGILTITSSDANAPEARILPRGVVVDFGSTTCVAERTFLYCRQADYQGGFEMNGIFARSSDFDDAPNGWPWDGVRYGPRDRTPGI